MTVVDTSAVVAVLLGEPGWERIEQKLLTERCVMSATTRVELGIVIEAKAGPAGTQLLDELLARVGIEVVPVDAGQATEAVVAWRRFGKGNHPAGLNLGDVFAYALARDNGEGLLFLGADFAQTDVSVA